MTRLRRLVLLVVAQCRFSRPTRLALAGLVLAVSPLAGCGPTGDTYDRPGNWRAEGVNDMNIAAQVADPHDLVRGRDTARPNYRTAATAVSDMWSGKTAKQAAAAAGAAGTGGTGALGSTP